MRAMVIDEFGGPEKLHLADVPEPRPGEHDLLIEVHASAINPVDTKLRKSGRGRLREFPAILGFDVSGVVRATGPAVQRFKVGDEVYASPSLARPGAHAELVAVDYRTAAHKPRRLSHEQAAALPLVTLTAWEALEKRAQLHRGETVLIHAGAGGVGHIALQIARRAGCRVLTTASRPESIAFCQQLGAEVVIDYAREDVVQRVRQETAGKGCPVVFDTIGEQVFLQSLECLAVDGRLVTILAPPADAPIGKLFTLNATLHLEFMPAPTVHGVRLESQGQILHLAGEYVDAGKLAPHVSKVIALEELAEGHRLQESGHVMGKIVVKVR